MPIEQKHFRTFLRASTQLQKAQQTICCVLLSFDFSSFSSPISRDTDTINSGHQRNQNPNYHHHYHQQHHHHHHHHHSHFNFVGAVNSHFHAFNNQMLKVGVPPASCSFSVPFLFSVLSVCLYHFSVFCVKLSVLAKLAMLLRDRQAGSQSVFSPFICSSFSCNSSSLCN